MVHLISRVTAVLAALSFAAGGLAQSQPSDKPADTKPDAPRENPNTGDPVTDDFVAGFAGDAAAMDRAVKAAKGRLAENPDNGPMLAWLGSAQGFLAGQAFQRGETADGLGLWTTSIRNLNHGVEVEPDNTTVRMLRGKSMLESSAHDPNPATSKEALATAVIDFEHIVKMHGDQIDKNISPGELSRIYGWLSQAYSRSGRKEDAERYHKLAKEFGFKEAAKKPDVREPATAHLALESALAVLVDEPAPTVAADLRAGLKDPARIDKVIAALDQQLAAKPEDAAALAWRGFARTMSSGKLFAAGKWPEGLKIWQAGADEIAKATSTDPGALHPRVLSGLIHLESARHAMDPAEARAEADRAAADFDRAWRSISSVAADETQPDQVTTSEKPAAKPLTPPAIRCELLLLSGESLWRAGNPAQAEQTLARITPLEPDAKVKARVQKLQDRMKEAAAKP